MRQRCQKVRRPDKEERDMEIRTRVLELEPELIALRRDLHRHPELGYEEYRTSDIVYKYLEACGLEVERICKTGVAALLRGGRPGKTLLLRADMDALPVEEETTVDYRSEEAGKMHACGHDAHTAMLLVAAKILAERQEEISGNIKFLFQPNEEGTAARDTIREGILENPKVDAAFAMHIWSQLESGKIGISDGAVMAALEEFKVTVYGKGGHTGAPYAAIDPVIAGCGIVQAVQQIQTREMDPREPTVIMVGRFAAGTASNVIPDKAVLEGTMRFLYADEESGKKRLKEKFEKIVQGVCQASSTEYQIEYSGDDSPAVINDALLAENLRKTAARVVEAKDVVRYSYIAGEDFAEFTRKVPGVFYFLGSGNVEKDTCYPHHHPKFNVDEEVMKTGVEMHVRSALDYLRS